jgi:hypothetical protein
LVAIGKLVVPATADLLWFDDGSRDLRVKAQIVDREPQRSLISLRPEPTPATAPQVDLYVSNEGSASASLGKAEITIQRSFELDSCVPPQGAGPELPATRTALLREPAVRSPSRRAAPRPLHGPDRRSRRRRIIRLIFRSLEEEQLDQSTS